MIIVTVAERILKVLLATMLTIVIITEMTVKMLILKIVNFVLALTLQT